MKELIDKYFREQDILKGCLLLGYHYDEAAATFTLVGRPGYFYGVDWSKNPFFKVHFTGVSKFQHVFPDAKTSRMMGHTYSSFLAESNKGAYEADRSRLKIDRNRDRFQLVIELTYRLGYITFDFMDGDVEFLFTNYKKIGENDVYFYPETNEPIDFYHPFGRLGGL